MNITVDGGVDSCCLRIEGEMTHQFLRAIEDRIIDCMRRYPYINVDLTGVSEIDAYGARLLVVLRSIGKELIRIVATSPVVEATLSQISRTTASQSGCGQLTVVRTGKHPPLDRLYASASPA